ncbi:hypothetical protein SAMN05421821_102128 [Mucilaginibacter lappiensis]|uniref:Uncharacterized protein n=1 Tax=Mucilaginibacter lappiensis TaxID=354630 RepID=A0ABR6PFX0_9SPHI|nr:hypothetical protein [Mucilaginibacter lappiensis]MBB6108637.1 hypothetical protein [Mucilaginibacter lappiensis]SIQ29893.1 hypothetical protein SAMN05421821_102128 [Mucilaginibacter lappiensis]
MPIIFNHEVKKNVFYTNQLSTDKLCSDKLIETNEDFEFQDANMNFQNWYFDGYRLANSILNNTNNIVTYNIKNDIDTVKFYFNRRGPAAISYDELGKKFSIQSGQYNLLYSSELNTQVKHEKGISEMFSLQLTRKRFFSLMDEGCMVMNGFSEEVYKDRPVIFSNNWLHIRPEIDHCIHSILTCQYIKEMKRL